MYFRTILLIALITLSTATVARAQHVAPPPAQKLSRTAQPTAPLQRVSAPTELYSHGEPTAEEQYVLEIINRARATPREEGVRLVTTNDPGVRGAYQFFNVDTAAVRAAFATYPVRPPLAFNSKLIAAARRHNADMLAENFQGHQGSDGSSFDQRLRDAGYTGYTAIGENVAGYAHNIWYAHVGFNVDWGNPLLGHRHNIMNFAAEDSIYREFGVAVIDTKRPPQQNQVGPIIMTQEFGLIPSSGPFLTGVVYNDANSNGFYDIGEGLPGVHVTPSTGTYYAITSASGGYAIPVRTAGSSFTVTFANGPLASSHTRSVTIVNNQNVKLDLAPTSAPGAVIAVRPAAGSSVPSDTVRFVWRRPMPNVDRYRLQVSRDSLMASFIVNDSTITDTSSLRTGFQNGTKYFWRVQAHNGAGWGEVGSVQSFTVVRLPAAVTLVSPSANGQVPQNDARFVWSRPTGPVTRYAFEIAHDESMTNLFFSDTTITDSTITLGSLAIDRYYWRVRARNESGWGPYSETRIVQVSTSGVDDEHDVNGAALSIASIVPNPATHSISLRFDVPRSGVYSVDLVDQLGVVVSNADFGDARMYETGRADIVLRVTDVEPGYYFLRVRSDDGGIAMHPFVRVSY